MRKTVKCHVCGTKNGLHEHHVIPQAYGGVNGPTVILCASHHTLIHSAALCGEKKRQELLHGHTEEQKQKLLELILIIRRARVATKYMRRPLKIQIELSAEDASKLRQLKRVLGCSSLQKTVVRSISMVAHEKSIK